MKKVLKALGISTLVVLAVMTIFGCALEVTDPFCDECEDDYE